jgi:hypothetical protein
MDGKPSCKTEIILLGYGASLGKERKDLQEISYYGGPGVKVPLVHKTRERQECEDLLEEDMRDIK